MLKATSSFLTLVLLGLEEEEAKWEGTMEAVLWEELGLRSAWNVEGWPRERNVRSPEHFMEAFTVSRALAVALPPDGCISGPITILL